MLTLKVAISVTIVRDTRTRTKIPFLQLAPSATGKIYFSPFIRAIIVSEENEIRKETTICKRLNSLFSSTTMTNGYVKPRHNKERDSSLFSFLDECRDKNWQHRSLLLPFSESFIQTTLSLLLLRPFFLRLSLIYSFARDRRGEEEETSARVSGWLPTRPGFQSMTDQRYPDDRSSSSSVHRSLAPCRLSFSRSSGS